MKLHYTYFTFKSVDASDMCLGFQLECPLIPAYKR